MEEVTKENKEMKETILDSQSRSMHNNLTSSSIPEGTSDNPKAKIKDFMKTHLNSDWIQ